MNIELIKDMDVNKKNFDIYNEYIVEINNSSQAISFIESITNKYIEDKKLFELLEIVYLINNCIEHYQLSNLSQFYNIISKIFEFHQNIKVKILYVICCLDKHLFDDVEEMISKSDKKEEIYLRCVVALHRSDFNEAIKLYNKLKNPEKYSHLFQHILVKSELNESNIKILNKSIYKFIKNGKYITFMPSIEYYFRLILENEYISLDEFVETIPNLPNGTNFILDFLTNLVDKNSLKLAKNIVDKIANNIDITCVQDKLFEKIGVSLVVACMNREKNLLQILPSWLENPYIKECVIVDYSSDQQLSENDTIQRLSKLYNIKLIRVENETKFNLGKAYNIGFDHATKNYIIKIDSDYKLIDSSFLNTLLLNKNIDNYFVRADFMFSSSMSGFFIISRSKLLNFREDLNGYGYDEIDLYNRIKRVHKNIQEIIWFNIDQSIYHIPHTNYERSANYSNKDIISTEQQNRYMCQIHSPTISVRNIYKLDSDNKVIFDKIKLDKVFCINLKERNDRWEKLQHIEFVDRFDAIKVEQNNIQKILKEYGFSFAPVNKSSKLYFSVYHGAFGAYISHYLLWEKIVTENINYALILEDDISTNFVENIEDFNVIFNQHDCIQLSKRVSWDNTENRMLFDGGESYIISKEAASKLIAATNCPALLHKVKPQIFNNVHNDYDYNWSNSKSIACPVDKFIGYCCEENAHEFIKLRSYIYPISDLNTELSSKSSIEIKDANVFLMDDKSIQNILTTKMP